MTSSKLIIRVHPSVQNDARARSWEHRYSWSKIVQQLFTTSDFAMKNGLQERRIEHTIWTAPALISSSCCCALWWSSSSVARWSFSSRWESSFARVASVDRGEITKATFSMCAEWRYKYAYLFLETYQAISSTSSSLAASPSKGNIQLLYNGQSFYPSILSPIMFSCCRLQTCVLAADQ